MKRRRSEESEQLAELSRRQLAGWPADEAIGTCVTRLETGRVDTLVRTKPGSRQEAAVIAKLGPALGRCVDNGVRMRMSRPELRSAVARAYYRGFVSPIIEIGQ